MSIKDEVKKVRDNVYEIPGSFNKKMRASGRLYLDDESFDALEEGAIEQIVNVACLPSVQRYSFSSRNFRSFDLPHTLWILFNLG